MLLRDGKQESDVSSRLDPPNDDTSSAGSQANRTPVQNPVDAFLDIAQAAMKEDNLLRVKRTSEM